MVQLKDPADNIKVDKSKFQFQYGAAERMNWEIVTERETNFNSSMVQLKVFI